MGTLTEFLFMLSSEERISILEDLQNDRMKLTQVSKKLDLTATEASRHLQRLSEAKLITKDSDGRYHLTGLGIMVINQLPNLRFLSSNSEYFLTHNLSSLPYSFQNRLGELSESEYRPDTGTNVNQSTLHSVKMLEEADEYIKVMTYQYPIFTTPIIEKRLGGELELSLLLPEGLPPPEAFRSEVFKRFPLRSIPSIYARVVVTDKEAQFGAPYFDGRADYSAFSSREEKFRRWCLELFEHYWALGKPLHP